MILKPASLLLSILAFSITQLSKAQPNEGHFINAEIGYAISMPYEDIDIVGTGLLIKGEYVIGLSKWFGVRPYAGMLLTWPSSNSTAEELSEYEVTSKIFMLGGKARLVFPIPYIAPFLEGGIGASLGALRTYTPNEDIERKGVTLQIPLTLGLALGSDHRTELAVAYFFHPDARQVNGGLSIGLSFPLEQ